MSHNSPFSLVGDALALSIIPAVWMSILPVTAYTVTIVWGLLQIYTWIINKGYKPRRKDLNG